MAIIETLSKAAVDVAKSVGTRVVVFLAEPPAEVEESLVSTTDLTLVIVGPVFDVKHPRRIRLSIPPNLDLESTLNLVSAFLIEQQLVKEGESFVYITSEILGVRTVKRNLFAMNGFFAQAQSVVQRLLEIAIELSIEGREGYPVGTLFVVGDVKNVLKHSHSMLPNPFRGHKINVLDRDSKEIIKEFAQLDGAFIVSSRGRIVSAGVYLEVDPKGLDLRLPPGLGTRHIAAAGITKLTKATAISLSESGTIRIFKNGMMLLEYNPRMKY